MTAQNTHAADLTGGVLAKIDCWLAVDWSHALDCHSTKTKRRINDYSTPNAPRKLHPIPNLIETVELGKGRLVLCSIETHHDLIRVEAVRTRGRR